MRLLCGRAGRLTAEKRRFPALGQTENCVPRCRQELNGDELLLNIFGEDSRLTCELHRSCMVQPLAELYGGCMVVLTVS